MQINFGKGISKAAGNEVHPLKSSVCRGQVSPNNYLMKSNSRYLGSFQSASSTVISSLSVW